MEQEAHGPQLAHLSETATADMQMACNIFPILSKLEQVPNTPGQRHFLIIKYLKVNDNDIRQDIVYNVSL